MGNLKKSNSYNQRSQMLAARNKDVAETDVVQSTKFWL